MTEIYTLYAMERMYSSQQKPQLTEEELELEAELQRIGDLSTLLGDAMLSKMKAAVPEGSERVRGNISGHARSNM